MSVQQNINVGWYCIIDPELDAYEMCEEFAIRNPKWEEFIVGTDPMCGKTDNYCVFNKGGYSQQFDNCSDTAYFNMIEKPPVPEEIYQFMTLVDEIYGDDSIQLQYGVVIWYS